MTNTFFEPGTDKVEDMIASISYGFYLKKCKLMAWKIRKTGESSAWSTLQERSKTVNLPEKYFLRSYWDRIRTGLIKIHFMMSDECKLAGTGYCGKGHKEWVKVSDGGPYIKAKIRLG